MKKLIGMFFTIIVFLVVCNITVFGAGTGNLSMSSGSTCKGGNVTLYVDLSENPGLISLRFKISYPEDEIRLKSVENTGLLKGWSKPNPEINSPYTVRWADALATKNNYSNGKILKLNFEVLDSASYGNKTVKLTVLESRDINGKKNTLNNILAVIKVTHHYTNACDKSCNICSELRTVAGHKTVTVKGKAATCTATGLTDGKKCSVCGVTTVARKTIAKKAHKLVTVKAKAATCTKTGLTAGKKCSVCNTVTVKQKTIAKKSHSYKTTTTKATFTKNGKIVKKCSVCGKVASTTAIKKVSTIKLSTTAYTYNGKAKTPTVIVKDSGGKVLKKNTDYTVTYQASRKNVGKYKVVIKLKGKYSGTKSLYFIINPAKTSVKSLTAGSKSLKVAITKKSTQTTGYQIQYSTNSKFKNSKTAVAKSYKTTSVTLKKLSAKKTYYVRVRTFKKFGSTTYYSGWSTAKSKKTK